MKEIVIYSKEHLKEIRNIIDNDFYYNVFERHNKVGISIINYYHSVYIKKEYVCFEYDNYRFSISCVKDKVYAKEKRCGICLFSSRDSSNIVSDKPLLPVDTGICKNGRSNYFECKKYISETCEQVITIEYI